MNWLIKKKGLVVLPALFLLFACDDLDEIGAELNPEREAISVNYVELPVQSQQLSLRDSLISSTSAQAGRASLSLGRFVDPTFGTTTSVIYANIGLPGSVPTFGNNIAADSLVLELYYENSVSGQVNSTQRIAVHTFDTPIAPTSTETVTSSDGESQATLLRFNYAVNNAIEYNAVASGELSFNLNQSQLDTLPDASRVIKTRLDQALASKLLTTLSTGDSILRNDQRVFSEAIGGLAIVPTDESTFTNTYRFISGGSLPASRLVLYYTQGTEKLSLNFPFSPKGVTNVLGYPSYPAFTGITTDYAATPLEGTEDQAYKTPFTTRDGRVYYQPISGLRPRFSYQSYQDFINSDTLGSITLNKAYLELDQVANRSTVGALPGANVAQASSEIVAILLDNNNNFTTTYDQIGIKGYVQGTDTLYSYRIDVTLLLESYLKQGNESFLNLVLSPAAASRLSLKNSAIDPEKVKLKIYYSDFKLD